MKLVNLTKQPVLLYDARGELVEIPADPRHLGVVALGDHQAVEEASGHTFSLNVQVVREIRGLPDPEPGTLYLVPVEVAMVLQAAREDVVFAAEDAPVRDATGQLRRITHLRRIVSKLPATSP